MKYHKEIKIGLISSGGGHLYQLYRLKSWWSKYEHFWVSFNKPDVTSLLKEEALYFAFYPESRNIINSIRNFIFAIKILLKEKPTHLISCGAGIAPPFFYVAKILSIKLIYIEPYDFIQYPSISGKLVEPITNYFLVQHRGQMRFFHHAIFKGPIL